MGVRHACNESSTHRIDDARKHNGHTTRQLLQRRYARARAGKNDVWRKCHQLRSVWAIAVTGASPSRYDANVAAVCPAEFLQFLRKCRYPCLALRVASGEIHQDAEAPHFPRLLCTGRERPGRRRLTESEYELPSSDVDGHLPPWDHTPQSKGQYHARIDRSVVRMSGEGRFCCRSRLMLSANRNSPALRSSRTGKADDGAAQAEIKRNFFIHFASTR